jgi:hypothetical protein
MSESSVHTSVQTEVAGEVTGKSTERPAGTDQPPQPPRTNLFEAARDRLRRGDLGSIPVAVGLVLIAVVF